MKLHFLTVMPSPYQRETFDALQSSEAFEVTVDYFAGSANDRHWNAAQMKPYERILPGVQLSRQGAAGRLNPAVLGRLRDVNADLVVISDYSSPTAQIAMRKLSGQGRAWVYWGEMPNANERGAAGRWLRRRLQAPLSRANGIASIGSRAKEEYERLFPGVTVFNIPYFCELDRFVRASAAASPREGERIRFLFSGQLIPRKGIDLLIEAFSSALNEFEAMELRILGEGPMRQELEERTRSLRDRFIFAGHVDPKNLPEEFAAADVFVLPSRHDGWGVVVNEALGAGLPIISSDSVGAARDLLTDGVNGFVLKSGDVISLRNAVVTLARDPALRKSMMAAAHQRREHWGLDEAVRRWLAASRELLMTPHPATARL